MIPYVPNTHSLFASDHQAKPTCYKDDTIKKSLKKFANISQKHEICSLLFGSGIHKIKPHDCDLFFPEQSTDSIAALFHYLNHARGFVVLTEYELNICLTYSLVNYFTELLSTDGICLTASYQKDNRNVIKMMIDGFPFDCIVSTNTILEHKINLGANSCHFDPATNIMYFPSEQSYVDFCEKKLNFLFFNEIQAQNELERNPTTLLNLVRTATDSTFSVSNECIQFLHSYIDKNTCIFKSINPDRLYHDFQALFFSGSAVETLEKLEQLKLLDAFLGYHDPSNDLLSIQFSDKENNLVYYLINETAKKVDENPSHYSTSLLYYAIHWFNIKNQLHHHNPYLYSEEISAHSQPKIHLPIDTLTAEIDRENREILTDLEAQYKNKEGKSISEVLTEKNVTNDPLMSDESTNRTVPPSSPMNFLAALLKEDNTKVCATQAIVLTPNSFTTEHVSSVTQSSLTVTERSYSSVKWKKKTTKKTRQHHIKKEPLKPDPIARKKADSNSEDFLDPADNFVHDEHTQAIQEALAKEAKLKQKSTKKIRAMILSVSKKIIKNQAIQQALIQADIARQEVTEKLNDMVMSVSNTVAQENAIQHALEQETVSRQEVAEKLNSMVTLVSDKVALAYKELVKNKHNLAALFALIQEDIEHKKYDSAIQECSELLNVSRHTYETEYQSHQQYPFNHYDYFWAYRHYQLGIVYMIKGELLKAKQCFGNITSQSASLNTAPLQSIVSLSYSYIGRISQVLAEYMRSSYPSDNIALKNNEAKIYYSKALELNPNLHKIHVALGKIEQSEGNIDVAIEHYKTYLSLMRSKHDYPLPEEQYQFLYRLAESICSKILDTINKESPSALKGINEQDKSLLILAREIYSEAIRYTQQSNLEAHVRRAGINFCLENFDLALEQFLSILQSSQETPCPYSNRTIHLFCGNIYKYKKEYAVAKKHYELASTEKQKNDLHNFTELALIASVSSETMKTLINTEQSPQLLKDLRMNVDKKNQALEYWRALDYCNFMLAIDENTYKTRYQSSQKTDFKKYRYHYIHSLYQRAAVYLSRAQNSEHATTSDLASSIADLENAIRHYQALEHKNVGFDILVAHCYLYLGKALKTSIHQAFKLQNSEPNQQDSNIAQNIYLAKEALEQAKTLMPQYAEIYLELGEVEQMQGNIHTAESHYLAYLQLSKNHFQSGVYFKLGKIQEKKENFGRALEYYQMYLSANPGEIELLLEIAHIEQTRGNFSVAETHYQSYIFKKQKTITASNEGSYMLFYELAEKLRLKIFNGKNGPQLLSETKVYPQSLLHFLIARYTDAINHLPSEIYHEAHIRITEIKFLLGNFKSIIHDLEAILASPPENCQHQFSKRMLHLFLAEAYGKAKEYETAKEYCDLASNLEKQPDDWGNIEDMIQSARTSSEKMLVLIEKKRELTKKIAQAKITSSKDEHSAQAMNSGAGMYGNSTKKTLSSKATKEEIKKQEYQCSIG